MPRIPGGRDWSRAHPYARRYLAVHAARAGRIDELIGDTEYLVQADPDLLAPAIRNAHSEHGRLMRTVYLASAGRHSHSKPEIRRQFLAVDAARCGATQEANALSSRLSWYPRWATGSAVSTALMATLTGHDGTVDAVACGESDGIPVAVTASGDGTGRVWDLRTGAVLTTLTGHDGPVLAVALRSGGRCPGRGHRRR